MGEKQERTTAEGWLDKATAGIRFGPDRREVRRELEEHLEDKALDFQRIFPDLTAEEAKERAASEMGDPAEIGKELAKVHKPWLGRLWMFSRVLLVCSVVLSFFLLLKLALLLLAVPVALLSGGGREVSPAASPVEEQYGDQGTLNYLGELEESGVVQAGEYTFTAGSGELWSLTGNGARRYVAAVPLEVRHDRPGEMLYFTVWDRMWAEDGQGSRLPFLSDPPEGEDVGNCIWITEGSRGVFRDSYTLFLELPSLEAEQVFLRYDQFGVDFTLPISLEVNET